MHSTLKPPNGLEDTPSGDACTLNLGGRNTNPLEFVLEGDDSDVGSDYGGNPGSKWPCYAEARGRGLCKNKKCEYSHDPAILKEYRLKKKQGN